ncbi:hypothetical protein M9H77_23613 [Catharanthus roseus]|uniref:Uncharacterized protein n=1 Tax=Catharanthus roseus TaxID=4058 RepID=A0ACC0AVB3_CATRO|nr:hypothetical protein M9H77_23613 [Catharanthus roseus]
MHCFRERIQSPNGRYTSLLKHCLFFSLWLRDLVGQASLVSSLLDPVRVVTDRRWWLHTGERGQSLFEQPLMIDSLPPELASFLPMISPRANLTAVASGLAWKEMRHPYLSRSLAYLFFSKWMMNGSEIGFTLQLQIGSLSLRESRLDEGDIKILRAWYSASFWDLSSYYSVTHFVRCRESNQNAAESNKYRALKVPGSCRRGLYLMPMEAVSKDEYAHLPMT